MERIIKLSDIKVNNRLRKLDKNKVKELADSIQEIGLINHITINNLCELIAGYHRLEACKLLGFTEMLVNVVTAKGLDAELIEIDENLIRSELSVLERGIFEKRRDEILDEMNLKAKVGDNQHVNRGGDNLTPPAKTTKELAAEMGESERSYQRNLQIAKNVIPEVVEQIRETPLANNQFQLLELSRQEPEKQKEVVAEYLKEPEKKITEIINKPVIEEYSDEEWELVEARRYLDKLHINSFNTNPIIKEFEFKLNSVIYDFIAKYNLKSL